MVLRWCGGIKEEELYEGGAVVLKKKNCMKVVRWY